MVELSIICSTKNLINCPPLILNDIAALNEKLLIKCAQNAESRLNAAEIKIV